MLETPRNAVRLLLLAALASIALSVDCAASQTDAAGALITQAAFRATRLAPAGDVDSVLIALDYDEGQEPLVFADDVNADGVADYLIISHARLCGTAGCSYALIDGRTMREIGAFFGHVALLSKRVNGYKVVQTISKRDLSSSNLSTYVFNGKLFEESQHALLDEQGATEWRHSIKIIDHPTSLAPIKSPAADPVPIKRR